MGRSGSQLLTAFVAAVEVMFRIGTVSRHGPESLGFQAPGLTGPYGAAIGCGPRAGWGDMVFPEAVTELEMYRSFAARTKVPALANMTEFGLTPLYSTDELKSADVGLALCPCRPSPR